MYIPEKTNILAFKKGTLHYCTLTIGETRKILVKISKNDNYEKTKNFARITTK